MKMKNKQSFLLSLISVVLLFSVSRAEAFGTIYCEEDSDLDGIGYNHLVTTRSCTFPPCPTCPAGTVQSGSAPTGDNCRYVYNPNQLDTDHDGIGDVCDATPNGAIAQTITVTTPAPASAANGSYFTVAATASSNLPVAITVSGGCSIASGVVTMTSGTVACTINYDQAGNANYFAAPQVSSNTNATKAAQVITVTVPFAPAFAAINDTFPVAATASSGLLVAITASGGCSGVGTGNATITMLGTGCVVSFNQAGDADYLAAPLVLNYTNLPVTVLPLDGTHKGARISGGIHAP